MGDTPKTLEGVPVVSSRPFHHCFPILIAGQETSDLGYHPVQFHYLQGVPPLQSIIILVYINKDLIQDLLPYAHNLLENFGLQCGCTSPYPHSEHVKDIMELNGFCHMPFNDDGDNLP